MKWRAASVAAALEALQPAEHDTDAKREKAQLERQLATFSAVVAMVEEAAERGADLTVEQAMLDLMTAKEAELLIAEVAAETQPDTDHD